MSVFALIYLAMRSPVDLNQKTVRDRNILLLKLAGRVPVTEETYLELEHGEYVVDVPVAFTQEFLGRLAQASSAKALRELIFEPSLVDRFESRTGIPITSPRFLISRTVDNVEIRPPKEMVHLRPDFIALYLRAKSGGVQAMLRPIPKDWWTTLDLVRYFLICLVICTIATLLGAAYKAAGISPLELSKAA